MRPRLSGRVARDAISERPNRNLMSIARMLRALQSEAKRHMLRKRNFQLENLS